MFFYAFAHIGPILYTYLEIYGFMKLYFYKCISTWLFARPNMKFVHRFWKYV